MRHEITVIAVVGRKKTGKTYVIERLIERLRSAGYSVATAKHIHDPEFSMDREGTDTWRHLATGAEVVAAVSEKETSLIFKTGYRDFSTDVLINHLEGVDILLLEGFSEKILADERVAKIICGKKADDYRFYANRIMGKILGFYAAHTTGSNAGSPISLESLLEKTVEYVRELEVSKLLKTLPHLDCGKCGYQTCREMAEAIYVGKRSVEGCPIFKERLPLKLKLTVNGTEVPIQHFVSNIIRSAVLGMVATLKGVEINGNEEVAVDIAL
ncbi:MAG: molybdopterin-guanine dinucleotide biosynthesis protein B [Candidatus Bathyarchaeia archaeon]